MSRTEIEDRRQRAREAFHDDEDFRIETARLQDALKVATQVKITPEVIHDATQAARRWSTSSDMDPNGGRRAGIVAALGALGFEIVE